MDRSTGFHCCFAGNVVRMIVRVLTIQYLGSSTGSDEIAFFVGREEREGIDYHNLAAFLDADLVAEKNVHLCIK